MTGGTPSAAEAAPRVVVITGASSGIGLAAATQLAERGDLLVLSSRSKESLAAAEATCRAAGAGDVCVVVSDVADAAAVERVADLALSTFGRLDAWVHTAAVLAYGRVEEVPPEVFRQVIDVNVVGSANVARTALRHFRGQRAGTLVLTSSLLGEITTPFMGAYVTSKWAVRGLARVLSIENRDLPDVHVCVVSPGAVDTPVYRQAGSYVGVVGRPPPPVDRVDKVARALVQCLDDPSSRVSVGPLNQLMRFGFTAVPWAFDRLVTPFMRLGGLTREPVEPNPGNVFQPRPEGERASGGYGRI